MIARLYRKTRALDLGRLLKFMYRQRIKGFETPRSPHLDSQTANFFEMTIKKSSNYLEFGSGGTTIIAGKLGIKTTSVESDPYYALAVEKGLSSNGCVNIIKPKMGITREWGWPVFDANQKGDRYVRAPFPLDPFPDLILIDGRYRVACALECARQAFSSSATAILILDDYLGRPAYSEVERYLGKPERVGRSAVFRIGGQPIDAQTVDSFLHIGD